MVKRYGELYLEARRALRASEGENASFVARELLGFASGKSAAALMADRELYASEQTAERMEQYTARALQGEPLAYILGKWSFYGLELTVTPDVLIPRDDTMAVTELAIGKLREMEPPQRVLDLCTGSGCIGLAIAHQIETARVTLADLSQPALRIARKNIADLKMIGRVNALQADVREPAPKFWGQFDLIVSNPPYVTAQEMTVRMSRKWRSTAVRTGWTFTARSCRISPRRCAPAAGSASNSASGSICRSVCFCPTRVTAICASSRTAAGSSARFAHRKLKKQTFDFSHTA